MIKSTLDLMVCFLCRGSPHLYSAKRVYGRSDGRRCIKIFKSSLAELAIAIFDFIFGRKPNRQWSVRHSGQGTITAPVICFRASMAVLFCGVFKQCDVYF